MPDRPAGRDRLCRRDDGIRIDAIVAVKIGQRTGLAEMPNTEWPHPVTGDSAEPSPRRRMPTGDPDDPAMPGYVCEQALTVGARMHEPSLPRTLTRRPAGPDGTSRR